jgi:hypothetical protein
MQEKRLFPDNLSQATPRLHVSCSCFNLWHFFSSKRTHQLFVSSYDFRSFHFSASTQAIFDEWKVGAHDQLCQHPLICFRTASVFGTAWLRLQITCEYQHLEAVFIPQTTCSLRMLIWVVALTRILSARRTTVTINIAHK